MPLPLKTAYEDRCVRIASAGDLVVAVWRDPPNRVRAAAVRTLSKQMHAAHPFVHVLHVVWAGDTSPLSLSEENRKEMFGAIGALKGTPSVMAIAFEGSSFFVASWRSILSAGLLLMRPDFPVKIVASRNEAAAFVERASKAAAPPTVADQLEAVKIVERGLLPP
jgi:hypothetical protein